MIRMLYISVVAILFGIIIVISNMDFYSKKDVKEKEVPISKVENSVPKTVEKSHKLIEKSHFANAIRKSKEAIEERLTDIEAVILFNKTLQFYLDKRTDNWWWVDDCLYSEKTIKKFRRLASENNFTTRMSEAGFLVIERRKDKDDYRITYPLPKKLPVPKF